ncbi:MAG: hypothetical protein JW953_18455 [Anaerolineae bacterium]|nr:hypothetical protein [Anaerolineae bacterium]
MKFINRKAILSLIIVSATIALVAACSNLTGAEPQIIVVTATATLTAKTISPTPEATVAVEPAATPTVGEKAQVDFSSNPYPAGTLLQGSGKDVFYLTENNMCQRIYDLDTFLAYDFVKNDVVAVEDKLLAAIPLADELTRLALDERGDLYWVALGERWLVK